MNKTAISLIALTAFILGALSSYLIMTKQQMDQIMHAQQQISHNNNTGNINPTQKVNSTNTTKVDNSANTVASNVLAGQNNSHSSINDFTEQQAQEIIKEMPDVVLDQYVDKFMTKDASHVINDKRRFAQRAIEELYKPNDNQPLVGEIKLSFTQSMPASSVSLSSINKNAKIYAHLDTKGQIPSSSFVFVKWVNNQTGQVLLFEKKDIVADSNQNWVSFKPYDGWVPGSYDIRFYQFTSELQPIAQLTYNIYNVTDTNSAEVTIN